MKCLAGCLLLLAAILAPFAEAHFQLLEPQSWLVENKLGDPQKLGPCGGYQPCVTWFVMRPTPSTSTVIASPGAMNSGGVRK